MGGENESGVIWMSVNLVVKLVVTLALQQVKSQHIVTILCLLLIIICKVLLYYIRMFPHIITGLCTHKHAHIHQPSIALSSHFCGHVLRMQFLLLAEPYILLQTMVSIE